MLKGYALRYLAAMATGAAHDEAMRAVPAPLRELAYRSARAHVTASSFETEHADDTRHVHRLAYLRALGQPAIDPNQVDTVAAAFEAKRDRGREGRAAIALIGASMAIALAIGGASAAAYWATHRPPPPLPPPAPVVDAAVPIEEEVREDPRTHFFRDVLPEWSVALDARSAGYERPPPDDVATARREALEEAGRVAEPLVAPLTALLDAADVYSLGGGEEADATVTNRLVDLHDALSRGEMPFYVDLQLLSYAGGRHRILLSSYRVRARRTFIAPTTDGERRVEAIELERLDRLNHERPLLGYTRPDLRGAVVLADQLEGFTVTRLLPSIHSVDESTFVRGYEDERDVHWVTTFEGWAHEDLAREARGIIPREDAEAASLEELAAAIVRRKQAIAAINSALLSRNVRFLEPEALEFDVTEIEDFRSRLQPGQLAEVRQSQAGLEAPRMARAARSVLDARALAVAKHEVQHRLDYEAGRLATIPPALADYVGQTESEDRVNERAERSNAELSAYLSQIARQPTSPRTELLQVLAFAMDRQSWGRSECYAALVAFAALAERIGLTIEPLVRDRRVVRSELARIYGALREREDAEIARLAGEAWAALYGEPLPELRQE